MKKFLTPTFAYCFTCAAVIIISTFSELSLTNHSQSNSIPVKIIPKRPVSDNKNRYFFISYAHQTGNGNMTNINNAGEFPSQKFLREFVQINAHVENVVILNIFEFKNKADYDNYMINE